MRDRIGMPRSSFLLNDTGLAAGFVESDQGIWSDGRRQVRATATRKNPMVGSRPACCARAAIGHATAPLSPTMKSSRRMHHLVLCEQPVAVGAASLCF
jgi:hypothetical protein